MGAVLGTRAAREAAARREAAKLAQSKTWVFTDFIDHKDPNSIDNTIDAIRHVEEDDLSDDEEVEHVIAEAKKALGDVISRQITHAILDREPDELRSSLAQAMSKYVPELKDASLVPEAKIVLMQELKKKLKKGIATRRQDKLYNAIREAEESKYFRGSTKTKAYKSMQGKLAAAKVVLAEEVQNELNDEAARLADPLLHFVDVGPMLSELSRKRVRLLKPEFIRFLKKNGRPLSIRQQLPDRAFLDTDKMSPDQLDKLKIVSVSFSRESPNYTRHPDPDGYHLSTISALLEKFQNGHYSKRYDTAQNTPHHLISSKGKYMSKKQGTLFREQLWDQGFCFGVGDGRPLGVFIDWCCLYQDFPPGSRTPLQTKVFQAAMEHIECWYANRHTTVWMLAYPYEPPNELVVTLLRGRNLMVKDNNWFSKGGSSDPLAHISVDCRRRLHQQKSITKKKTLEPEWNQTFVFPNVHGPENLYLDISVEDEDWLSGNDFMGMTRLAIMDFEDKKAVTKWLPLADTYPPTRNEKGLPNKSFLKGFAPDYSVPRGELEVRVEWRYNPKLEQMETTRRRLAMSKGRLWLNIVSARDLLPADKNGVSDPYATCELVHFETGEAIGQTKKHKTNTVYKTLSPKWNAETFEWTNITLGKVAVVVKIFDADMVTSAPLGNVTVPLCDFEEVDLLSGSSYSTEEIEVKTYPLETFGDMKELATGEVRIKGWVGVTDRIKFPAKDVIQSEEPEMADAAVQVEMENAMSVRAQLLFDEACAHYSAIDGQVRKGEASWNSPSDTEKLEIEEIINTLKEAAALGHAEAQIEVEGCIEDNETPKKKVTALTNDTLDFVMMGARDLIAADRGGTSDPFAIVELVDARTGKAVEPKQGGKTKTINKTLEPTWNERITWMGVKGDPNLLAIKVAVYDADMITKENLGEVVIPVKDWPEGYVFDDGWYDLSLKGVTQGAVQVQMRRETLVEEEEEAWWEIEERAIREAAKEEELRQEWWKEPDYLELSELEFHSSVWTTFDRTVAAILTRKGDILEISADERIRLIAAESNVLHDRDYMQFCLDAMDQREDIQILTPEDFSHLIKQKHCAAKGIDSICNPAGDGDGQHKSDTMWLSERYGRVFQTLFSNASAVSLVGTGLRDSGARRLMDIVMESCRHLVEVDVSINEIAGKVT